MGPRFGGHEVPRPQFAREPDPLRMRITYTQTPFCEREIALGERGAACFPHASPKLAH